MSEELSVERFLEHLGEVFCVFEPTTNTFSYISKPMIDLLGYTPEDFLSQKIHLDSIFQKEDKAFFFEIFRNFFYGNRVSRFRTTLKHRDGFPVLTSWTAVFRDGEWYVLIQDIRHLAIIECDLVRERSRLELIVDKLCDIVFQTDAKGTVLYANWRVERILGVSVSEILWRPLLDFLKPSTKSTGQLAILSQYFANESGTDVSGSQFEQLEFIHVKPCGTNVYLIISVATVIGSDGEISGRIGTIRDETALERKKQELYEASRFSSLGQMAAGVAHEINNPLAVVTLILENLREDVTDSLGSSLPAQLAKSLDLIESSVQKISQIVKSLQLVSGVIPREELEDVNIGTLVFQSLELCKERFAGSTVLIKSFEFEDFIVHGRKVILGQAIFNVVLNAFEAIKNLNSSSRWIKVSSESLGSHWLLRIENGGPLIPLDERAKIFQPFFTTKDIGKGAGLGLSVSRGVIESHGGSLVLEAESTNTCFVFHFENAY